MSGRCRTCDAKVPPGVDQCPACRTERLPIADLGSGPILTDLPAPDQKASAPPPLIGRDRELQQLCALAAEAAQQNEVRFCLVTAPGGAGKTRLLRELSQSLGRQAPPPGVRWGRAGGGG